MNMKIWTLGFLIASIGLVSAQEDPDDLLDFLNETTPEETVYTTATFKGTRIVNLQSNELPAAGVSQFMFMHRFGALNNDFWHNFMGLDQAQVRISLDYSPLDWINFGVGRSSYNKTSDGFLKMRWTRQSTGARHFPVSISSYHTTNLNMQRQQNDLPFPFSNRLSYSHQLLIARKFNGRFSALLAPTLVHFNFVERRDDPNTILALGMAGRYKLTNRVAVTVEYTFHQPDNLYILNEEAVRYRNVLTIGVDIETGGHVFQLHVTNARAMNDPEWIARTRGSWEDGGIFFGFNISRVFTVKKPAL
jgi:hypothetical protein